MKTIDFAEYGMVRREVEIVIEGAEIGHAVASDVDDDGNLVCFPGPSVSWNRAVERSRCSCPRFCPSSVYVVF